MFKPLPTASMTVGQILANTNRFTVPVYQRSFSWTVEEAAQLLEDVAFAAGIDEGQATESDYFLGAILLLDPASAPDAGLPPAPHAAREFEIVDGQQRFVTLTILTAALRDFEPDEDTPLAARLAQMISFWDAAAMALTTRIGLSAEDSDFFYALVQAPGGTQVDVEEPDRLSVGQRSVVECRDRLRAELAGLSADQRRRLAEYICNRCHFVVVTTSDIDRAHRIFMVLNDRGRPLQRKDILKAEILKAIDPGARDAALEVWKSAEASLGEELENFFSYLRTAYGFGRQQVIAGMRQIVEAAGGAEPFMRDVFAPMSGAFTKLIAAADPQADLPVEIRRPLIGLQRLNGREWVPAVLHVLARVEDPGLAATYLSRIERAAFLMRLVCLGAGKRVTRFARIASTLAVETLPPPESLYEPSREELRTIAYNLRDLHSRNVQACKALLLRINDELQPAALFANPASFTVEHVLPQRPKATSLWRQWFPDSEERISLTASLGNLVLVSQSHNDRARNDEYERKKEVYGSGRAAADRLAVTDEVLARDVWGREEILEREARLVAAINAIWGLDLAVAAVDEAVA